MILETNRRVSIKPMTNEHAFEFIGNKDALPSYKGFAFFYDDVLAAIAGVRFHNGVFVVFSNIKSDIEVGNMTIFRCAQIVMKMCEKYNSPLYAFCDTAKSGRFLEKLGWVYRGSEDGRLVYKI